MTIMNNNKNSRKWMKKIRSPTEQHKWKTIRLTDFKHFRDTYYERLYDDKSFVQVLWSFYESISYLIFLMYLLFEKVQLIF
jgi:uncharacterized protein YeaO (DUF488 family)